MSCLDRAAGRQAACWTGIY